MQWRALSCQKHLSTQAARPDSITARTWSTRPGHALPRPSKPVPSFHAASFGLAALAFAALLVGTLYDGTSAGRAVEQQHPEEGGSKTHDR